MICFCGGRFSIDAEVEIRLYGDSGYNRLPGVMVKVKECPRCGAVRVAERFVLRKGVTSGKFL
jgi:hypothetical protein